MSAPASAACSDLLQRVGLDLDFQIWKFFARAPDRGGDGVRLFVTQRGEVVVLDEHHVEQAQAMVVAAAAGDGVFLKPPPAGRGFARVENLRRRAFDGIDKLRGQGGHAGKPLDKIQRHALGAQNRARRAGNFQQSVAAVDVLAVLRPICSILSFGGQVR